MSDALNGPIPGQSLTTTPNNFPWERPPETEKPEEALLYHVSRMADEDFIDGATTLMEVDVPIEIITNTVITNAVGEGIHTVDVGLIIAPAVHKELVSLAKNTGVEYREFFSDDIEKEELEKSRLKVIVLHKMKKKMGKGKSSIISETSEALGSAEVDSFEDMRDEKEGGPPVEEISGGPPVEEISQEVLPEDVLPEDMGTGLMSRGA